jgi:hypothetical protein
MTSADALFTALAGAAASGGDLTLGPQIQE